MHLSVIIEKQIAADRRRGFPVDFETDAERHAQLSKDLVGLLGEIGEFANLVKKIGLRLDLPKYIGPSLDEASDALREELADATIYIMRLATILKADLEHDILTKMAYNDKRYSSLETD
jgi:NTP pyrophosphatase (non-canonical NTP hydrolase)